MLDGLALYETETDNTQQGKHEDETVHVKTEAFRCWQENLLSLSRIFGCALVRYFFSLRMNQH